jgi:hypothetical protein
MMTTTPPAVRILPMSTEEFSDWTIEELQQKFFLEDLPFRPDARYRHYKAGLKTPPGSVVLFQYRKFLVASAIFRDAERFMEPDEDGYEGALYFDTKSIRVFDPIGPDVVSEFWHEFKGFSHVKWSLNPEGYAAFQRALKQVEPPKQQAE